jgi:uracil-DNA glycosylase
MEPDQRPGASLEYLIQEDGWRRLLGPYLAGPGFANLWARVSSAYDESIIYPPKAEVFRALELCPPSTVKAVILGQDPYHGSGQATGLSFAVPAGTKLPPSLKNIFTEYNHDLGKGQIPSSDLMSWASHGVLLLNTCLTVEEGKAGSHADWGWRGLTEVILENLGRQPTSIVFILWGRHAQSFRGHIREDRHLVLSSAHPSPLSAYRGFFGSRPFSQTNRFLLSRGRDPILWAGG